MILQAKYNTNIVLYKIVGRVYIMILFDKFKKMSVCWRKRRQFDFFSFYIYLAQSE